MSTPTDAELAALDEAGPLLRFAAEHVEALDPSLSLAIAEAVDAHQNQHWTPETSQKFWQAFARLCTLIKPVTMESLAATHRTLKARSWFRFWRRGQNFSLAERTSSRYLSLLFFLLAVVTLPQLYIWVSASLSRQLDDLVKDLTVRSAQLTTAFTPIAHGVGPMDVQRMAQTEQIKSDAVALEGDASHALYYSSLLQRISSLGLSAPPTAPGSNCTGNDCDLWYNRYQHATEQVQLAKTQTLRAEVNANLISGVFLSFVLPILFGAIGAVAYVIRTISDQISSTTFSNSSPIRHVMRVMLGALMGAVIGLFVGLTAQLSLPPLALAFLAGYSVEAVFSMFDGLVARFRQPQPATAGQSPQGTTAAIVHQ